MKVLLFLAVLSTACGWCEATNTYLISFHRPDAVVIVDEAGSVLWKAEEPLVHPQDCAVTATGDILCSEKTGVVALGLDQSVKWRYTVPEGAENPIAYPLGPDRFLIAVEGPTQLLEINSKGDILKTIQLSTSATEQAHGQIRGARKTKDGTYLVAFYREGAIREYNEKGEVVRDFGSGLKGAIGIARLGNGNTLLAKVDMIWEVDSDDHVVWDFVVSRDTTFGKAKLGGVAKLKNGNVMTKFYTSSKKVPTLIEIAPDKSIVREISVPGYVKAGHFQILTEDFKPSPDVVVR
ncbi:beta-propeller domain-containing protein [Pontiella sulfatireligans]|uniref:Outer membrane protein assembly factor BamB n=1 Tax=Pontiella sulfatireligans TaxID=2750658 RepID=A0A6C2UEV2_9BACT|nr:hypothetical protein [Pontiella sulfatireligans]VGO18742.1 hypothetical protein SCARR_00795 [Pontiella sulfatireligans]